MQTKFILVSVLAVILSFVGGFLLANSLNKADIEELTKKNAELSANASTNEKSPGTSGLTESEIESKLKEAAERPKDFNFQKKLAFDIYGYAINNRADNRFDDVDVLLTRALSVNPDDFEVIVASANLKYQLAEIKKSPEHYRESKELFEKAIEKRPKDLRVLTDFAATLLESPNPDPAAAIDVLEKAYEIDAKSEVVVNGLVRAYMSAGNVKRASELVIELKRINPENPLVKDIDNKLNTEASQ